LCARGAKSDFNATETALKLEKALTQTAAASATEQAVRYPSATPTWTDAQKAAITPTAVPPTVAPTSTPGIQPPACTFPLAQTTVKESKPEKYTFSEPKVMLTAPKGNYYDVVEWLPDNQRVLITEELNSRYVENNSNSPQQSISLYNPETGKIKLYAIRQETNLPPLWQPTLNAVVYPIMNYFDIDRKNRTYKLARQVWVSYGNPDTAQMIANNLPQLSMAIKPGGNETIYLSDTGISKLDKSLRELPIIPFDVTHWDYAATRRDNFPVSFKMAWQSGTALIFLYSEGNGKGGYTFILDANTGQICELNLGGMAFQAHWSLDGRYLAVIRSTKYFYPTFSADLTVLDSLTGDVTVLDVMPKETKWLHLINDFAWAPDNHHLLAVGEIYNSSNSQNDWGLYLTDFVLGQSTKLVSANQLGMRSFYDVTWSSDGSKLLFACPAQEIDQLCFISVKRSGR
jgi:hypothetical protein